MAPAAPPLAETWSARLSTGDRHLVLPDGCMDLVFRDGPEPELFWVGPMTRAERVAVDAPATYLGVRFGPGVGPALAGVDARDAVDGHLAADPRLLEALASAGSDRLRRTLLARHVAALRARAAPPDALVVAAATAIFRAGGAASVAALARGAGVSERTLHRRFLASVGYGPKRLCRVARLGLARALAARGRSGAELAAEAGYFDQAHLCHELGAFGVTAAALAA